jgi:hypothetical protein
MAPAGGWCLRTFDISLLTLTMRELLLIDILTITMRPATLVLVFVLSGEYAIR